MHSCHTTILLQNVYLTTSNNLTKYLSVAGVSSYSTRSLNIQKKKPAKNVNFGSYTHIPDAKMDPPSLLLGRICFAFLKHIGVQIKENITGKTAIDFLLFWQNTGLKRPVCEPSSFKHLAIF